MLERNLVRLINHTMFTKFKVQKFSKKTRNWYTSYTYSDFDLALHVFTCYPEYRICCTNDSGFKLILEHK